MNHSIIIRTGISPENRQSRYADDLMRLQEPVESLHTLTTIWGVGRAGNLSASGVVDPFQAD